MIRRISAYLQKQTSTENWKNLLKETVQTNFFRQGMQMSFWRILSLAFATLASIWAARCLGPEKLGISGLVITTIAQLSLLVNLSQNNLLVRLYKKESSGEAKNDLIATVFTFRTTLSIALVLLAIPILFFFNPAPQWHLALLAGIPFFLFSVNPPDWILQSDGKVAATYKALTVQSVIVATLYLLFFRPGIAAGYDVAVYALAYFISCFVSWNYAVGHRKLRLFQWHLFPRMFLILRQGRWLVLTGIVVYTYGLLESPLLGYLYSIPELGIYRTAISLVGGVQALLTMIPALLFPRFIDWKAHGITYLWERQKKITLVLLVILLPISVFAFLVAPTFYHYAYSPKFERAAYPFALLLTAKFIGLLGGIFSMGLYAHHQDKNILFLMSGVAVISLTLNLMLIPHFGAMAAASVNLISELLMLTGNFTLSRRYVRQQLTTA